MKPRTIYAGMAIAIGRFNPNGVDGYRAATAPNGRPFRPTREAAVEDERKWLEEGRA